MTLRAALRRAQAAFHMLDRPGCLQALRDMGEILNQNQGSAAAMDEAQIEVVLRASVKAIDRLNVALKERHGIIRTSDDAALFASLQHVPELVAEIQRLQALGTGKPSVE